jgi:AcrR family transcriptional regulator
LWNDVNCFILITMKSSVASLQRKTGRPSSFDRGEGLHKAMLLFWAHGYEATSLADLTREMGITPPSLYYAFGDKKRLFFEALGCYLSGEKTSDSIIASAKTAKEAAWGLLETSAIGFTGVDTPPGCMLASSAISCSASAADVKFELTSKRLKIEKGLRQKISRAAENGEFRTEIDADALAGHVMVVIQGMSTLARDGASRNKLMRIAKTAMLAWPA